MIIMRSYKQHKNCYTTNQAITGTMNCLSVIGIRGFAKRKQEFEKKDVQNQIGHMTCLEVIVVQRLTYLFIYSEKKEDFSEKHGVDLLEGLEPKFFFFLLDTRKSPPSLFL